MISLRFSLHPQKERTQKETFFALSKRKTLFMIQIFGGKMERMTLITEERLFFNLRPHSQKPKTR
jgi:hypothetical protein